MATINGWLASHPNAIMRAKVKPRTGFDRLHLGKQREAQISSDTDTSILQQGCCQGYSVHQRAISSSESKNQRNASAVGVAAKTLILVEILGKSMSPEINTPSSAQ